MADIFQPVHLLSFLMQTADPVHKSDTCAAASNVMFLIAAPIDCALQISDTCSSIESSLLYGAASVFTIKISTGACCMIRSVCSAPPSLIYGRLREWHLYSSVFPDTPQRYPVLSLPLQIIHTGRDEQLSYCDGI